MNLSKVSGHTEEKKEDADMEAKQSVKTEELQSDTDPLGMWTGVPKDPHEKPVQDADDL